MTSEHSPNAEKPKRAKGPVSDEARKERNRQASAKSRTKEDVWIGMLRHELAQFRGWEYIKALEDSIAPPKQRRPRRKAPVSDEVRREESRQAAERHRKKERAMTQALEGELALITGWGCVNMLKDGPTKKERIAALQRHQDPGPYVPVSQPLFQPVPYHSPDHSAPPVLSQQYFQRNVPYQPPGSSAAVGQMPLPQDFPPTPPYFGTHTTNQQPALQPDQTLQDFPLTPSSFGTPTTAQQPASQPEQASFDATTDKQLPTSLGTPTTDQQPALQPERASFNFSTDEQPTSQPDQLSFNFTAEQQLASYLEQASFPPVLMHDPLQGWAGMDEKGLMQDAETLLWFDPVSELWLDKGNRKWHDFVDLGLLKDVVPADPSIPMPYDIYDPTPTTSNQLGWVKSKL